MKLTTKAEPCIAEALHRLDTMDEDVSEWESNFLDHVMRGTGWSTQQRRVLAQMCEKYLSAYELAAEIRGQQRLL